MFDIAAEAARSYQEFDDYLFSGPEHLSRAHIWYSVCDMERTSQNFKKYFRGEMQARQRCSKNERLDPDLDSRSQIGIIVPSRKYFKQYDFSTIFSPQIYATSTAKCGSALCLELNCSSDDMQSIKQ